MKTFTVSSLFIVVLWVVLCGTAPQAVAQWSQYSNFNTPVCNAINDQAYPASVNDGSGGTILTWRDSRTGPGVYDIYAQRISAAGVAQWKTDGVVICAAVTNVASPPVIVSDGSGGAIIVWDDLRNGSDEDVYAQRINAAGVVQWAVNGVAICTATDHQVNLQVATDDSGGAIVTWQDRRSATNFDIYAQRINPVGAVVWTADGVGICKATGDQQNPAIAADDSGGAIIAWYDIRGGGNNDIYTQRVSASGAVKWTTNGLGICTAGGDQYNPQIVMSVPGGAIITWYDNRSGPDDIYAQSVDAAGTAQWAVNGIPICTSFGTQTNPTITSDGSQGAIITWHDNRNDPNDIYAQRVSLSGIAQWTSNGVVICSAPGNQNTPKIVSDGAGGAIITWQDNRNDPDDIYAQRINPSGVVLWADNGVPICTATNDQIFPTIMANGTEGAIIAWQDGRSDTYDIYVQRVDQIGFLGKNEPNLVKVKDVSGDQGGFVTVAWAASPLDIYPNNWVLSYSVWRGIDMAGRTQRGPLDLPPHARAIRVNNVMTYWEPVGEVTAHYLSQYSFTAPTLMDSGASGNPKAKFFVSAETNNQFMFWDSNVDSGYSVDNLAPHSVLALTSELVTGPSVKLAWKKDSRDPDIGQFEIHRSATDNFTPDASTKIGSTADTLFTDATPVGGVTDYYRVIAVDIHGNRGPASPQTSVLFVGVGDRPQTTPSEFALRQNYPNPFNPTTDIQYDLPTAQYVRLSVYDFLGREVARLVDGTQSAGYKSVKFDAGGFPSGIYFYNLKATSISDPSKAYTQVKKMLLLK